MHILIKGTLLLCVHGGGGGGEVGQIHDMVLNGLWLICL